MTDDLDRFTPTLAELLGINLDDLPNDSCRHPEDRSEQMPCNYGNCVTIHCLRCDRWIGGWGTVGCACDNSRGWRKGDPRQMSRPHPPVKAIGRRRGKILRRRAEVAKYRAWVDSASPMEVTCDDH